jgi:DNA polymerase III subunit epsilon
VKDSGVRHQHLFIREGERKNVPKGLGTFKSSSEIRCFEAHQIPPGFYSKTRLRRLGFKPAGPPRGRFRAFESGKLIPLYDVLEAAPRRKLKQSQRWVINKVHARIQAIARARELTESNAVILDTETTGIGPDAEIIEIAIVDSHGATLVNTLVRPQQPIPPEATAIHHLRDEDVVSAPPWPEVWPPIAGILADREVVAYNAAFDMGMVVSTCERYSISPFDVKWECLMLLYWKQFQFEEKFRSLRKACEKERLLSGSHRALADALAAQRLLRAIAASPTREVL